MNGKVFLDSNIFLYVYSTTEPSKSDICKNAINENDCCTSTQALNELSNVCAKKWKIDRISIEKAIDEICSVCEIKLIKQDTIKKGLYLNEKYKYSYYDSLMLASALENDCQKIFTEDMHDGQLIENKLTIVNILKEDKSMKELENKFHSEMVNSYQSAKKLKYNASYFWQMVCEKGGYQTAKQLIHTEAPSEGFTKLWELERLELSVEAHVIKNEYNPLFTGEERKICYDRLEEYGYKIN